MLWAKLLFIVAKLSTLLSIYLWSSRFAPHYHFSTQRPAYSHRTLCNLTQDPKGSLEALGLGLQCGLCSPDLIFFQIPLAMCISTVCWQIYSESSGLNAFFSGKLGHNVALMKLVHLGYVGFFSSTDVHI